VEGPASGRKNTYYEKAKKAGQISMLRVLPKRGKSAKSALKKFRKVNLAVKSQAYILPKPATVVNQEQDHFTRYKDLISSLINDEDFEINLEMFL
jgi:ribosomal protein L15